MGGYGSGLGIGAWAKETVENCLVLSSAKLQRDRLIRDGMSGSGSLKWTRVSTGEEIASIGYAVDTMERDQASIRLKYTRTGRDGQKTDVDEYVGLATTPLPWGGVRWWFRCPACGRRCGKLYKPPSGTHFACRLCYDLTYQSSQEANVRMYAYHHVIAAHTGYDVKFVRQILRMTEAEARRKGSKYLYAHWRIHDALISCYGLY